MSIEVRILQFCVQVKLHLHPSAGWTCVATWIGYKELKFRYGSEKYLST